VQFTFVVEVEVERAHGKFATREEIAVQIQEALEGADPGQYDAENEGEYGTTSWDVRDHSVPKTKQRRKRT